MPRLRNLVVLVVAVFALGALAQFPAERALSWFAPDSFQAAGIDGSVWAGDASRIAIGNNVIDNVTWDFLPAKLITGRPAYRLTGTYRNLPVEGVVKPKGNGVILEDVSSSAPIAALSALAPVAGLDGRIQVDLERAVVTDGWPERLAGVAQLTGFETKLIAAPLGDYRVVFPGDTDNPLTGRIEDLGGPLKVSGQLDLSQPDQYKLTLIVDARTSAPALVRQFLNFLPEDPGGGGRRYEQTGRINTRR